MAGGIRVLVVDDTTHVRKMLSAMLSLDGFDVVGEAESGPVAVELATYTEPDVIVMDYRMPKVDGLAATRAIRAVRPDQIIVLYTAFVDAELEEQAAEAGISMVISKVGGLVSLEREIGRLCSTLS